MGSSPAGSTNTNTNNYGNNRNSCRNTSCLSNDRYVSSYGHTSTQHGVGRVGSIQRQHQIGMEKEQKVTRTSPWVYAGLDYPKRVLILNKQNSCIADLEKILQCCALVFDTSPEDIIGTCRKQQYTMPRHAFCKLTRERTSETFSSIGQFLSGRDHATVVNSSKKARDLIETYPWFRDKYKLCEKLLTKAQNEREERVLSKLSKRVQFVRTIELDQT